jgi:cytochrome c oxidase subunit IV
MISDFFALGLLFIFGVGFDQTVQLIINSSLPAGTKVFLLTVINFVFVLAMIAAAYFVDGFAVHGVLPDGLLDIGLIRWQLMVECVFVGYLWTGVASFLRLILER